MADLSVTFAGHRLRNPVMSASGCGGCGPELHRFFDVSGLGAVVTPSVTASPRAGGGVPRLLETPAGLVWDSGLPNPGVDAFAARDLAWLRSVGATVIASVAGSTSSEYSEVVERLGASESFDCVLGVELNLSVPNESTAGRAFDEDALAAATVVGRVRGQLPRDIAVLAKIAVDATDLVAVAAACVEAGADALTIGNGARGLALDVGPPLGGSVWVAGRVSGPATRPLALLAVRRVHEVMLARRLRTVPIIGVGGVGSARDALEFLVAGATAVQVGSATFGDPTAPARVRDELSRMCDSWGHPTLAAALSRAAGAPPP
ncbi:dihydroorotate dehydrogenase [Intrasporangium sp. DVR]|uniref:dihydroorotate dehydrogenase n=1 Tax=Intrasporangium sp. DVR TaxID=3127867 RepID=UPI00313A7495